MDEMGDKRLFVVPARHAIGTILFRVARFTDLVNVAMLQPVRHNG